ncbi:hypothetical protein T484DRAFT_1757697 [Baffinella frigidus]|nr:hypothetical protein T484DRAFT_1757697 [Cryptophyta sp. CCMP2293]
MSETVPGSPTKSMGSSERTVWELNERPLSTGELSDGQFDSESDSDSDSDVPEDDIHITRELVFCATHTYKDWKPLQHPGSKDDMLFDTVNYVGRMWDLCNALLIVRDGVAMESEENVRRQTGFRSKQAWTDVILDLLGGTCCRPYSEMVYRLFLQPWYAKRSVFIYDMVAMFLATIRVLLEYHADKKNKFCRLFDDLHDCTAEIGKFAGEVMSGPDKTLSLSLTTTRVRQICDVASRCYKESRRRLVEIGIDFYEFKPLNLPTTRKCAVEYFNAGVLKNGRLTDMGIPIRLFRSSTPLTQLVFKPQDLKYTPELEGVKMFGGFMCYIRLDHIWPLKEVNTKELKAVMKGRELVTHACVTVATRQRVLAQLKNAINNQFKLVCDIEFKGMYTPITLDRAEERRIRGVYVHFTNAGMPRRLNTFLYYHDIHGAERPWYMLTIICNETRRLEMSDDCVMKELTNHLRKKRVEHDTAVLNMSPIPDMCV